MCIWSLFKSCGTFSERLNSQCDFEDKVVIFRRGFFCRRPNHSCAKSAGVVIKTDREETPQGGQVFLRLVGSFSALSAGHAAPAPHAGESDCAWRNVIFRSSNVSEAAESQRKSPLTFGEITRRFALSDRSRTHTLTHINTRSHTHKNREQPAAVKILLFF